MKKLYVILLTAILAIAVVGCNNKSEEINQQYEQAMADGKSNVIEEEYEKAIDYFKLALESKEKDTEATNLIKQLELLVELLEEDGVKDPAVYFYQIQNIDEINSIKTNTDVVKDKANKYKEVVLGNIYDEINNIEIEISNGDYENDLEYMIEQCKECKLEDQLDRCNELLDICKEKKKEAKEKSRKKEQKKTSYDEDQAYCSRGSHYTDAKNMFDEYSCKGCQIRRDFNSSSTNTDCIYCGAYARVQLKTGVCLDCGKWNYSPIVDVYEDGTVVYEDGTSEEWNFNNM